MKCIHSFFKSLSSLSSKRSHQVALQCLPDGRGTVKHEGRGDETVVGVIEDGNDEGLGLAVEEGEGVGGSHDDGEQEENGKRVDTKLGGQQVGSSVMVQLLL